MPNDPNALARRQRGLLTRAQARAAGWSNRQIRYRLRQRVVREVQPGVLAPMSQPDDPQLLETAALLASGPTAALTGRSAAAHWRLPGFTERPPVPELVVTVEAHLRRLRAGRRRRASAAIMARVVSRRGVRVVSLEDCVCDLAARLRADDLEALVTQLVRHERRTTPDRLLAVCAHGRRGSAALRRAVAATRDGARSVWERRLARLLTAAGVPPEMDHPVFEGGRLLYYLDLCYPDIRLAVEVDGWSTHGDRVSFRRDRHRKRRLVLDQGWYVIEVTPADIRDHPDEVVAAIRRFVRERRQLSSLSARESR